MIASKFDNLKFVPNSLSPILLYFLENLTSTINGALEKPPEASICSITVESNEVINQENMQEDDGSLKSPDLSMGPTSSLSEDTSQVKY